MWVNRWRSHKTKVRNALLIQNISEYLEIVDSEVEKIAKELGYKFRKYTYEELGECLDKSDLIKWIICEELELIYGMFAIDHLHNHVVYEHFHNRLTTRFSWHKNFSVFTAEYIKAPKLYDDNNVINVRITKLDLYIEYKTSTPAFQNRFPHLNTRSGI